MGVRLAQVFLEDTIQAPWYSTDGERLSKDLRVSREESVTIIFRPHPTSALFCFSQILTCCVFTFIFLKFPLGPWTI